MSAVTRFERLDDMFPEMFRRLMRPMPTAYEAPAEIRVDVSENDKAYEVRAEVPGAKKSDIHITIDGNYVSITTEVKRETEEKSDSATRARVREIYYGSATRGFTLAQPVDPKTSIAKFEDGVLKLTLPKIVEAASRTITIQ